MDLLRRLGVWLFWFAYARYGLLWVVWAAFAGHVLFLVATDGRGLVRALVELGAVSLAIRHCRRMTGYPLTPYNPFAGAAAPRTRDVAATLLALGAASLGIAATPRSARAQEATPAESAPVLAAVQGVLDAIAHHDSAAAHRWMEHGSVLFGLPPGGGALRPQSDSAFAAFLATSTDRYLERIWNPRVLLRGAVAVVWAPYDFHVNGRRSHCGVDTFTVVRGPAGWRVAAIAYTVEPTGCPDSPLGPPPA